MNQAVRDKANRTPFVNKQMERVYRYTGTYGFKRAIEIVAGEDIKMKNILTARYNKETQEFQDAGGY